MIVFDLACDNGHRFEAWFKDSAAFERQAKKKLLSCALCGSARVRKAPMAPRIGGAKGRTEEGEPSARGPEEASYATDPRVAKAAQLMKELTTLRQHVEQNADYVGKKFAEEARKIHYGETEKRNIYGEATKAEAKELSEEGVEFARIPWVQRHNS
jgi:hypothetical protein